MTEFQDERIERKNPSNRLDRRPIGFRQSGNWCSTNMPCHLSGLPFVIVEQYCWTIWVLTTLLFFQFIISEFIPPSVPNSGRWQGSGKSKRRDREKMQKMISGSQIRPGSDVWNWSMMQGTPSTVRVAFAWLNSIIKTAHGTQKGR